MTRLTKHSGYGHRHNLLTGLFTLGVGGCCEGVDVPDPPWAPEDEDDPPWVPEEEDEPPWVPEEEDEPDTSICVTGCLLLTTATVDPSRSSTEELGSPNFANSGKFLAPRRSNLLHYWCLAISYSSPFFCSLIYSWI